MRKQNRIYGVLALAASALLLYGGCSRNLPTAGLTPVSGPPIAAMATTCTASQANNCLSSNLYNFYQSQSGNIFFSPFSIITAMAMAQEGAKGNTAVQMRNVLNLNSNTAARLQDFQQLIGEINSPNKHYTLDTADNLWIQQNFPVLASYINTCQTYYDAGVTDVDFRGNPSGALQTINGAVSQETAGYIPNLLSQSNITPETKLVLTNAIYFKGSWQYQFPVTNTVQQTFNLASGSTEPVSMMNLTFNAAVGSYNGAASVLAVPYTNSEASMYIFLPPLGGMAALESALSGNNINSWLASNSPNMVAPAFPYQVALSLPKFSFRTSYDLTNTLSQMGMPLAFTLPIPGPGADFSGIDAKTDLYISDVVHKAYVDVNETGTTAAAATGVVITCQMCTAVSVQMITPFIVDHPFIFMLVENTTNTVLFMGRVNDPLSNS